MLGGGEPPFDGCAHRLEGEKLQEDEVSSKRPPDHSAAFIGAVNVRSDHQAHSETENNDSDCVLTLSKFKRVYSGRVYSRVYV